MSSLEIILLTGYFLNLKLFWKIPEIFIHESLLIDFIKCRWKNDGIRVLLTFICHPIKYIKAEYLSSGYKIIGK